MFIVACRTGNIYIFFFAFFGRAKVSAKRVKSARHAQRRKAQTHVSRAPRPLRASFARKKGGKSSCSAGDVYHEKKIVENWFLRGCFLVTEKEEESWGEVIRKGRNESKGKRNFWSSVNEGSRNQRQTKRGKFFTFYFLSHTNIFLNAAPAANNFFLSPSSCKHFIFY